MDHVSLRTGDLTFLAANDADGTLAYLRRTDEEASVVAINTSAEARTLSIDLGGRVPAGTTLLNLVGGDGQNLASGPLVVELPAHGVAVLVSAPGTDLAPPASPAQPATTWQTGSVTLDWTAVPDAASYAIWRSILPGGGYELAGTTTAPTYADTTVRNGMRYFYVVTARDNAGNESARSPEADARPSVELEAATLEGPATLSQPLSAVDAGASITALIAPAQPGSAAGGVGIRAQLGIGDAAVPEAAAYAWSEMTFVADADGGVRFAGAVRPQSLGTFDVVLRVSTDGGAAWSYADRGGISARDAAAWTHRADQALALTAVQGADTTAPAAPSAPRVETVGDGSLTLAWPPVADGDLFRYEILRGTSAGGPYQLIGMATEPRFTDNAVSSGAAYRLRGDRRRHVVQPIGPVARDERRRGDARGVGHVHGHAAGHDAAGGHHLHRRRLPGLGPGRHPDVEGGRPDVGDHGAVHGGGPSPVQVHARHLGGRREGRRLRGDPQPDGPGHLRQRRHPGSGRRGRQVAGHRPVRMSRARPGRSPRAGRPAEFAHAPVRPSILGARDGSSLQPHSASR